MVIIDYSSHLSSVHFACQLYLYKLVHRLISV